MSVHPPASPNLLDELCLRCGLCCNGVLFADVELQRGDDAKRLKSAGFPVMPKGRKKHFSQPCHCFDGKRCGLYSIRPTRCMTFECAVLKRANRGTMSVADALSVIRNVQRQAAALDKLLGKLGQTDATLPLLQRYRAVMSQPIDLSNVDEDADLRGRLMSGVHRLMEALHQHFLSEPGSVEQGEEASQNEESSQAKQRNQANAE